MYVVRGVVCVALSCCLVFVFCVCILITLNNYCIAA